MVEEVMKKSSGSESLASLHSVALTCAHLHSGMKHTAQKREIKASITFYDTLKHKCVLLRCTKSLQGLFVCPKCRSSRKGIQSSSFLEGVRVCLYFSLCKLLAKISAMERSFFQHVLLSLMLRTLTDEEPVISVLQMHCQRHDFSLYICLGNTLLT